MAKITKRAVDAPQSVSGRDVFIWDSELRGFGVRVKPSGVRTFLIQYRNVEGRTRRLVLGQYGALTPENARDLAREKLAGVAKGEDPSAERHAVRAGMSVAEVCDWYLEQAEAGRILGRNRRPIKASTLQMDRSRIETHIKPLLGSRLVSGLTLKDIEGMQADIAAGKSARGRKKGRGGKSTGGRRRREPDCRHVARSAGARRPPQHHRQKPSRGRSSTRCRTPPTSTERRRTPPVGSGSAPYGG